MLAAGVEARVALTSRSCNKYGADQARKDGLEFESGANTWTSWWLLLLQVSTTRKGALDPTRTQHCSVHYSCSDVLNRQTRRPDRQNIALARVPIRLNPSPSND